jgi:hypothetical protein
MAITDEGEGRKGKEKDRGRIQTEKSRDILELR